MTDSPSGPPAVVRPTEDVQPRAPSADTLMVMVSALRGAVILSGDELAEWFRPGYLFEVADALDALQAEHAHTEELAQTLARRSDIYEQQLQRLGDDVAALKSENNALQSEVARLTDALTAAQRETERLDELALLVEQDDDAGIGCGAVTLLAWLDRTPTEWSIGAGRFNTPVCASLRDAIDAIPAARASTPSDAETSDGR